MLWSSDTSSGRAGCCEDEERTSFSSKAFSGFLKHENQGFIITIRRIWELGFSQYLLSNLTTNVHVCFDRTEEWHNSKTGKPARGNNLIASNSQELPHKTQADPSWGACHQDYSAWHFKSATVFAEIGWVKSTFLEGVSLVLAVWAVPELFWHHSSWHISLDLRDRFSYDCTVHLNY